MEIALVSLGPRSWSQSTPQSSKLSAADITHQSRHSFLGKVGGSLNSACSEEDLVTPVDAAPSNRKL